MTRAKPHLFKATLIVFALGLAPVCFAQGTQDSVARCQNANGALTPEQAIQGCNELLQTQGVNVSAVLTARGIQRNRAQDREAAMADFNEAIRVNPQYAYAFLHRGRLRDVQEEYTLAIADYTEAIRLRPDFALAYDWRGDSYAQSHNYEQALIDYDHAAALAPNDPYYINDACRLRAGQLNRELDRARTECERGVSLSGGTSPYIYSRGLVNFRQGRFQEAWNDFDAGNRAIEGGSASFLYGRGISALRLGRTEEGHADIARAREMSEAAVNYWINEYHISP